MPETDKKKLERLAGEKTQEKAQVKERKEREDKAEDARIIKDKEDLDAKNRQKNEELFSWCDAEIKAFEFPPGKQTVIQEIKPVHQVPYFRIAPDGKVWLAINVNFQHSTHVSPSKELLTILLVRYLDGFYQAAEATAEDPEEWTAFSTAKDAILRLLADMDEEYLKRVAENALEGDGTSPLSVVLALDQRLQFQPWIRQLTWPAARKPFGDWDMPESDRERLQRLAKENERLRQTERRKSDEDQARHGREFDQKTAVASQRNEELKKWCEEVFLGHSLSPKGYTIQKLEIVPDVPALGLLRDKYPNHPWICLTVPSLAGGAEEKQIPILAVRYSIEGCYDAAQSTVIRSIHNFQIAKSAIIDMVSRMDDKHVSQITESCAQS